MKKNVLILFVMALLIASMIGMTNVSAATSLKVQCFNGNTSASTNTLYVNFKLVNTGTDAIALSNVKMRYYFTNDGTQDNSFACDWASAGNSNITGSFVGITPVTNADRYLEVGFTSGAGNLAAGASTEVKCRVWKSDWSNFTQTNDYSFNSTGTNYTDWTNVTAFISGTLYWGTSPGGSAVTPTATPLRTATPVQSGTPSRTATPRPVTTPTPRPVTTPTPNTTLNSKVMPLGDSITDGTQVPGGYRIKLWSNIRNAGLTVDFVGSLSNGPSELGDKNHEGHSGWRIDQIDANINTWMTNYSPKIVLLHIGTNDVLQNYNQASAPSRLSALIDKICAKLPAGGKVYVAKIIPLSNSGQNQNVINFNNQIPGIVQTKVSQGKPVYMVDMYSALTTADLIDGVHPTLNGYNKMADVWFNAIRADLR